MTVNDGVRGIGGAFVLISVALGIWVNPWFFAFTAFVGANLLQSAFTHWCPMMWILQRAGLPEDHAGPRAAAPPVQRAART